MQATPRVPPRVPLFRRASVRLVAALLVIAAVGAACQQASTLPDAQSPAAQLFVANCARCHGPDAKGLSGPNLRTGLSAATVTQTVTQGVAGRMPSFKGQLSPDQITELANYIERIGAEPSAAPSSGDGSSTTTSTMPPGNN